RKVAQQLHAEPMALLRMELRTPHIAVMQHRAEVHAVAGDADHVVSMIADDMVGMDEIEPRRAVEPAHDRIGLGRPRDVPAHVRHAHLLPVGGVAEVDGARRNPAETRLAPFLAAGAHELHAEADPDGPAWILEPG